MHTRFFIGGIAGLAAVASLALFAWVAWRDHERTIEATKSELSELTQLMEKHTEGAITAVTVQLKRVADLLAGQPLREASASPARRALFSEMLSDIPGAHSLWLFDAEADLVATTMGENLRLNVGDREYFTALRDDPAADLFISPLIAGRIDGRSYFAVSKKLRGADGGFRGVAQLSIDANAFHSMYTALGRLETAFTIVKRDGAVVIRVPLPFKPPGKAPLNSPLFTEHLPRAPTGTYVTNSSVFDKNVRIAAYRENRDGLVVVASRTEDAVLGEWRRRTATNGVLAGIAALAFSALGMVGWCSARRESRQAAQLAEALAEKDLLFQEIHHRVKNNLQIISSMLTMQQLQVKEPETRTILQEALDRIHSMGLVHHTLYLRNEASRVDMPTYLRSLADTLSQSYGAGERGIAVSVEAEDLSVDLDRAIPLALLANEALSNALKHAFRTGQTGSIVLSFAKRENKFEMTIKDDGIGLPAEMAQGRKGSIGLRLITSLAQQIDGSARFEKAEPGTAVRVMFPAAAAAAG